MISRNLYINIIIRVTVITILSLATAWSVVKGIPPLFPVAGVTLIIWTTAGLIRYVNGTNRRINTFLQAVENEDTMLTIPPFYGDRTIKELGNSLGRLNSKLGQLTMESRRQEYYLQALLEHVATGIISFSHDGFVIHANSAAKNMFSVEVFTHLRQLERVDRNLFQAVSTIRPGEQRLVTLASERGTVQLSLKASSFSRGEKELILLSVQDIRNELDEKELDSWMKLISVMMHEIINTISPITSLSESLGRLWSAEAGTAAAGPANEENILKTVQGLGVIRSQGKGLLTFIESYRKLTHLPKPEKKIIEAGELFDRITVIYSSFECALKARLSVSVTPPGVKLYADETQLALCLVNLVKNAMQANEDNPEGHIELKATIKEGRPLVSVTDNGPGISKDVIGEVFVPFFTTRKEGSGIGLSISRQIMRLHGGTITVKSVPGRETVFELQFLPASINA
jgi:signal transduction histidine kinase